MRERRPSPAVWFIVLGGLGLFSSVPLLLDPGRESWRVAQSVVIALFSCTFLYVGLNLGELLPARRRQVVGLVIADALFSTLGWAASIALDSFTRTLWFLAFPLLGLNWLIAWFLIDRVNRSSRTPMGSVSDGTTARQSSAGWYPDPTARHEKRYWDGAAWTAHVLDGERSSLDPLGSHEHEVRPATAST